MADFIDEIRSLSVRIKNERDIIQTEEATKTAFVMPFINILGYNVFNPREVVPEFTADVGTKQGEKVDYAIFKDDEVIMLMECKKCGEDLSDVHTSQLFRYFAVVNARFGVLTDGIIYRFYTDLEESNKMDVKPFLELDLLDIQPPLVSELKRFTKSAFDLNETLTAANDLKWTKEIKETIMEQLEHPNEDFVKFFLSAVYKGLKTQAIIGQFTDIVRRAFNQFINEQLNQRLQNAITNEGDDDPEIDLDMSAELENETEGEARITRTEEELEAYYIVKSIVREVVNSDRIFHRDTVWSTNVILDNSQRKPICRLRFNGDKKSISLFSIVNGKKEEKQLPLESMDDIYNHAETLKAITAYYDNPKKVAEENAESEQTDIDIENTEMSIESENQKEIIQ